ncbi:hypothetical protein GXN76_07795 [Kroppenstedtia pulmonis]|uniref:Chemotaxis methyl-accepting receptor HlyB-like 4HB MCP domain-containing protein n=1 Tax=Kroppenstedtia pulmonis TaxID=1380685 RepID=A0A7D3XMK9_9BACL|nr:hypothetical protein [Kroppenstedtia pulmonis]QKG84389.1 hypothetical protein GXN76_07795 [Kroppenstedtia pulmonis]
MSSKKKKILFTLAIYLSIALITLTANLMIQSSKTQGYIQHFKEQNGEQILEELSDTYKLIMESYSNYKLDKEAKAKVTHQLNRLNKELRKVDKEINSRNVPHPINFSFIYQDMKLVNLALADSTKDGVITVIVLHAMEGLGDLKKEITYIQYR